jgi:phage tail-like protein
METNTHEQSEGLTWPSPSFQFEIDLSEELRSIVFLEADGMNVERQLAEHKMPGITQYGKITLRYGTFPNEDAFWQWQQHVQTNTTPHGSVLLKLRDNAGEVTKEWLLHNAWVTKMSATELRSDANQVKVGLIEIAHEGLTILK